MATATGTAKKAARKGTWNPAHHPRDARGRFTKSSTRVLKAVDAKRARDAVAGFKPVDLGPGSSSGHDWLGKQAAAAAAADDAVSRYFAGGWKTTNNALRTKKDAASEPDVIAIDKAMKPLSDDVMLERRMSLKQFAHIPVEQLEGMKVRDAAYQAAALQGSQGEAPDGMITMHMAVPAGTRAIINPETGGIVLDRDTETAISRVEPNGRGGYDMYGVVIPRQGAAKPGRPAGEPGQADRVDEPNAPAAPAAPAARKAGAPGSPDDSTGGDLGDQDSPAAAGGKTTPGGSAAAGGAPAPKKAAAPALADRIHDAHEDVLKDSGGGDGYAMLSDVRKKLPDVDKKTLDAELIKLNSRPDVHIIPESNQKALTPEQRAGALSMGNQDKHLISFTAPREGRDRGGDQGDAGKAPTPKKSTAGTRAGSRAPAGENDDVAGADAAADHHARATAAVAAADHEQATGRTAPKTVGDLERNDHVRVAGAVAGGPRETHTGYVSSPQDVNGRTMVVVSEWPDGQGRRTALEVKSDAPVTVVPHPEHPNVVLWKNAATGRPAAGGQAEVVRGQHIRDTQREQKVRDRIAELAGDSPTARTGDRREGTAVPDRSANTTPAPDLPADEPATPAAGTPAAPAAPAPGGAPVMGQAPAGFVPREKRAQYRKDYLRGWRDSSKPADKREGKLEAADGRNEAQAWYDGWSDVSTDEPKFWLAKVNDAEEIDRANGDTPYVLRTVRVDPTTGEKEYGRPETYPGLASLNLELNGHDGHHKPITDPIPAGTAGARGATEPDKTGRAYEWGPSDGAGGILPADAPAATPAPSTAELSPGAAALATMTPVDRAHLAVRVEDSGPGIFQSPANGGSHADVGRYVAEDGRSKALTDKYGTGSVWAAAEEHARNNPDVLNRSVDQVKARQAERAQQATTHATAAAAATKAGNFEQARQEIAAGELVDPTHRQDFRSWDDMRDIVDRVEAKHTPAAVSAAAPAADARSAEVNRPERVKLAWNDPNAVVPLTPGQKSDGRTVLFFGTGTKPKPNGVPVTYDVSGRPNARGQGGSITVRGTEDETLMRLNVGDRAWFAPADRAPAESTAGTSAPAGELPAWAPRPDGTFRPDGTPADQGAQDGPMPDGKQLDAMMHALAVGEGELPPGKRMREQMVKAGWADENGRLTPDGHAAARRAAPERYHDNTVNNPDQGRIAGGPSPLRTPGSAQEPDPGEPPAPGERGAPAAPGPDAQDPDTWTVHQFRGNWYNDQGRDASGRLFQAGPFKTKREALDNITAVKKMRGDQADEKARVRAQFDEVHPTQLKPGDVYLYGDSNTGLPHQRAYPRRVTKVNDLGNGAAMVYDDEPGGLGHLLHTGSTPAFRYKDKPVVFTGNDKGEITGIARDFRDDQEISAAGGTLPDAQRDALLASPAVSIMGQYTAAGDDTERLAYPHPLSAPKIHSVHEVNGRQIAVVQYAELHQPTRDAKPEMRHSEQFYAVPADAEYKQLTRAFYRREHYGRQPGDSQNGSYSTAKVDGAHYSSGKTAAAALAGARSHTEKADLRAKYEPVALRNVGVHGTDDFNRLDPNADIKPGDLVMVHAYNKWRTGVAYKVTGTKVHAFVSTPSGGHDSWSSTGTKGTGARLIKARNDDAPPVPSLRTPETPTGAPGPSDPMPVPGTGDPAARSITRNADPFALTATRGGDDIDAAFGTTPAPAPALPDGNVAVGMRDAIKNRDGVMPAGPARDSAARRGWVDDQGRITPAGKTAIRDRTAGDPAYDETDRASMLSRIDAHTPPGDQAAPAAPAGPAPIPAGVTNDMPLTPNSWGGIDGGPVDYHDDGEIGSAVKRLGADARLDVDGLPLAEHLARLATDNVKGRSSAQQQLDDLKTLRDRLPAGPGKRAVAGAVTALDSPQTPVPDVPDTTPGPLRQLMADLHAVPLVRYDGKETDRLAEILARHAEGRMTGRGLIDEVRRGVLNNRHESKEGKAEIDRAARKAVDDLEALRKSDRNALTPEGARAAFTGSTAGTSAPNAPETPSAPAVADSSPNVTPAPAAPAVPSAPAAPAAPTAPAVDTAAIRPDDEVRALGQTGTVLSNLGDQLQVRFAGNKVMTVNAGDVREHTPAQRETDLFGGERAYVPGSRAELGAAPRVDVGRERAQAAVQQLGMFDTSDQKQMDGQTALLDSLLAMPQAELPREGPGAVETLDPSAPEPVRLNLPDDVSHFSDEQLSEAFAAATAASTDDQVDTDSVGKIMAEWDRRESEMNAVLARVPEDLTTLGDDDAMKLYADVTAHHGTMNDDVANRLEADLDRRDREYQAQLADHEAKRELVGRDPASYADDDEFDRAVTAARELGDYDAQERIFEEWTRREDQEKAAAQEAQHAAAAAQQAQAVQAAQAKTDQVAAQVAQERVEHQEAANMSLHDRLEAEGLRYQVEDAGEKLADQDETAQSRRFSDETPALNQDFDPKIVDEFYSKTDPEVKSAAYGGFFSTGEKKALSDRAMKEHHRRESLALARQEHATAARKRRRMLTAPVGELSDDELNDFPALMAALPDGENRNLVLEHRGPEILKEADSRQLERDRRESAFAAGPAGPAKVPNPMDTLDNIERDLSPGSAAALADKGTGDWMRARGRMNQAYGHVYGLGANPSGNAIAKARKEDPRDPAQQAAETLAWYRHLGQFDDSVKPDAPTWVKGVDDADFTPPIEPMVPEKFANADQVLKDMFQQAQSDAIAGDRSGGDRYLKAGARMYRIPHPDGAMTADERKALVTEVRNAERLDPRTQKQRAAHMVTEWRRLAEEDGVDPFDSLRYGPSAQGAGKSRAGQARKSDPVQEAQINSLVAGGMDWIDAYAQVHKTDADKMRRQETDRLMKEGAPSAKSLTDAYRQHYTEMVYDAHDRAEAGTRGHMLNDAGKALAAKGRLSTQDLFTGSSAQAYKYASEDLKRWWGENPPPRMTFSQWRQTVQGDPAGLAAARQAQKGNEFA